MMSHGLANGANGEALERALKAPTARILLYVNARYPFTRGYGDAPNTIHVDAFQAATREGRVFVVDDEGRLPALPANRFATPDPRDVAIAEHVVNHIELNRHLTFGRALQVSFGGTGVLAIRALKGSAWHGRVYTEMLEPFTWELLEAGKVRGSHFVERDGRRSMGGAAMINRGLAKGGVAEVSGKSQSQFVKALIDIADPRFRDWLRTEAYKEFRIS